MSRDRDDEYDESMEGPPGCPGGHQMPVRHKPLGGHIIVDGERVDIMNGVCSHCRGSVRMRRDGTCVAHKRRRR